MKGRVVEVSSNHNEDGETTEREGTDRRAITDRVIDIVKGDILLCFWFIFLAFKRAVGELSPDSECCVSCNKIWGDVLFTNSTEG